MERITVTVTERHNVAAVMAASYAAGNTDPQAWLQSVVDAASFSYRDQFRTDFIDSITFMARLSEMGKLQTVLAAAQQSPDLAGYLDRMRQVGGVWAGSPETAQGIGALVAGGLLTQDEADELLAYELPELPE